MIPIASLQKTAEQLMAKAAIEIPDDYLGGLRRCANTEKGDLSAFVIQAMLENYEAAKEDRRAMCGDTGVPRWYVKIGNEARIEGGPVALEAALRRATANATHDVPLRPNRVHPLWRTDHNNNCGIGAPEIEYSFHPDADWIDLTTVHKGGLFGTDYRMLFPGDGIDGIRRFYLDTLIQFGRRGLACQPAIVGVGLGGSKDISMILGKQAACLRTVGSRNPDPKIAELEAELKELGNTIGMGAMGFMGSSMVVDCHIEVGYCHTGGMPMSVHMFCLSSRRATARVFPDGRAEFRTDPEWFTDYMRRPTVEWEPAGKGASGGVGWVKRSDDPTQVEITVCVGSCASLDPTYTSLNGMAQDAVKVSKFLSLVLRHEPGRIGLPLDREGWADIGQLIERAAAHGMPLTREVILHVVETSDKQRFALDSEARRIRANQGHSIDVDLALDPTEPPAILFHGTAAASVAAIRASGLKPGSRRHVHLSPDEATATRVGRRHGKPVVLRVHSGRMWATGTEFFCSANGVWLTLAVAPEFIEFPQEQA